MPTLSKCKTRQQSGVMHYPSGQRRSTKPHHHCHERRTRLHMRISFTSEVLSARIHQEKPRPFRLASSSVAIWTVFSRVRFSAVFSDAGSDELLKNLAWGGCREFVCLPFPLRVLTLVEKPITAVNTTVFDFAWASSIFRIFVVRATLVRFPVDRQRFLYVPVRVFFYRYTLGVET